MNFIQAFGRVGRRALSATHTSSPFNTNVISSRHGSTRCNVHHDSSRIPARTSTGYRLTAEQMTLLQQRINRLNNLPVTATGELDLTAHYLPFITQKNGIEILGYLTPFFAKRLLSEFPSLYSFHATSQYRHGAISLHPEVEKESDSNKLTQLIQESNVILKKKYSLKGWRNEFLPVATRYGESPKFHLERAMIPYFGIKAYGVHINGYVYDENSLKVGIPRISHIFVARRSRTKSTFPSMLDHIVAGGQPSHISLFENVLKECLEEANISTDIAANAIATGAIAYNHAEIPSELDGSEILEPSYGNLKRDVLFCYDLPLPADFTPTPVDGEVESFMLKDVAWILDKMVYEDDADNRYKPNCILVIVDFLIR